jgi:hypothetical protein
MMCIVRVDYLFEFNFLRFFSLGKWSTMAYSLCLDLFIY